MSSDNYRVTVNLSYFFENYKSLVYILISKTIHTIKDFQDKISMMFNITDFYLTCDGKFIHPAEDVRILKIDDCIWAVPLNASEKVAESVLIPKIRLRVEETPMLKLRNDPKYLQEKVQIKDQHAIHTLEVENVGFKMLTAADTDVIKCADFQQQDAREHASIGKNLALSVINNEEEMVKEDFVSLDYKCSNELNLLKETTDCLDPPNDKYRLNSDKNAKNCSNQLGSNKIVQHDISSEVLKEGLHEQVNFDTLPILKNHCKEGSFRNDLRSSKKNTNSNATSCSPEIKISEREQTDLQPQRDKVVLGDIKIINGNSKLANEITKRKNTKNVINIKSQIVIKPNGNVQTENSTTDETLNSTLCSQLTNNSKFEDSSLEESQSAYSMKLDPPSFFKIDDVSFMKSENRYHTDCSSSSFQRKRKRTRKRKEKVTPKSKDKFYSKTFKFSSPKVEGRPLIHIKFDTEDEDNDTTNEPIRHLSVNALSECQYYNQETEVKDVKQLILQNYVPSTIDKCETDINYVATKSNDKIVEADLLSQKETSTSNIGDSIVRLDKTIRTCGSTNCVNTVPKCDSSFMEISSVDPYEILALPVVNRLPETGDFVSFKILKLSENYCPEISSSIIGKVQHYDPDTNDVILKIIHGMDQCTPPKGKFALESSDSDAEVGTNEKKYKWTDFIEPKLHELQTE